MKLKKRCSQFPFGGSERGCVWNVTSITVRRGFESWTKKKIERFVSSGVQWVRSVDCTGGEWCVGPWCRSDKQWTEEVSSSVQGVLIWLCQFGGTAVLQQIHEPTRDICYLRLIWAMATISALPSRRLQSRGGSGTRPILSWLDSMEMATKLHGGFQLCTRYCIMATVVRFWAFFHHQHLFQILRRRTLGTFYYIYYHIHCSIMFTASLKPTTGISLPKQFPVKM